MEDPVSDPPSNKALEPYSRVLEGTLTVESAMHICFFDNLSCNVSEYELEEEEKEGLIFQFAFGENDLSPADEDAWKAIVAIHKLNINHRLEKGGSVLEKLLVTTFRHSMNMHDSDKPFGVRVGSWRD